MLKYYQLRSERANGIIKYHTKEITIIAANNGILWDGSSDYGTYTDMKVSEETSTHRIVDGRYLFSSEAEALSWVEKAQRTENISLYKSTLRMIRSTIADKAAATRRQNELLAGKSKMEANYPYLLEVKEE